MHVIEEPKRRQSSPIKQRRQSAHVNSVCRKRQHVRCVCALAVPSSFARPARDRQPARPDASTRTCNLCGAARTARALIDQQGQSDNSRGHSQEREFCGRFPEKYRLAWRKLRAAYSATLWGVTFCCGHKFSGDVQSAWF
ncbi:hypothetical protein ACOMHN_016598 [Nucella lapillus]